MEWLNEHKKQLLSLLGAFFLGAFWVVAIRFVTVQKKEVHYHANFAVFVEGTRLPFDNFTFYEEVQSCFSGADAPPQARAHMHDKVNHVVHVHDNTVTWGHFFANLGMTTGDILLRYDKVVYIEDEDTPIRYLLNNEEVDTVANRVIGDEDTLLISVNPTSDDELQEQYDQITRDAADYNLRNDPSACSGGKPFTFTERLKAAIGISNE